MMQIASNADYAINAGFDINLAAAIQLKNMVQSHWKYHNEADLRRFPDEDSEDEEEIKSIIISEADKEFVKVHIIQACAHAPSFGVLALFEDIVYMVARYEMPENWPNAMLEITELLQQDDENKVFGGLTALKEVIHRFEFEFRENRLPLQEIVNTLFPRIEEILVNLLENNSELAIKAKNIIMETLFLANNSRITDRYHSIENFSNLTKIIIKGFTQELPEEYTNWTENTTEIEKLQKCDFWKFKTKCIKILNKFMIQLSDPEMAEEKDVEISQHFQANIAKEVIDIAFLVIEVFLTKYVSKEVVSFAVRIIAKTEKVPCLLPLALARHEDIVFKYSLPLIRLTP